MLELIAKAFELFGFLSWCFINCQLFILLERTEKTRLSMQFFSSFLSFFKAFIGSAGEFSGTGPTPPLLAERKGLKYMRFMHQERHPPSPALKGLEQQICASAMCSVNQITAFLIKAYVQKFENTPAEVEVSEERPKGSGWVLFGEQRFQFLH